MPLETHLYGRVLTYIPESKTFMIRDPDERFLDLRDAGFLYQASQGRWITTDIAKASKERASADGIAKQVFFRYYIQERFVETKQITWPHGLSPLPHQIEAAHFALSRNRSYLWLDPGMGKTIISALILNHSPGKTLVVCPSFLKWNWKRELMKWSELDDSDIFIVEKATDVTKVTPEVSVIVFPDSLAVNSQAIQNLKKHKFRWAFIDEAHRYKTAEAVRTHAVFGGFKSAGSRGRRYERGIEALATQVVSLSGTAMPNFRPIELWPVLYSQAPGEMGFMNRFDFGMKYGAGYHDGFGYVFKGSSNEDDLRRRFWGKFILRMEKTNDIPKEREIVLLDDAKPSPEFKEFSAANVSRVTVDFENLGDIAKIRRLAGEAKLAPAIKFLTEHLENTSEKLVVFAHHRDVIQTIDLALKRFGSMKIYGDTDLRDRDFITQTFQKDASTRVVVCNMAAAGVGITLTAASRVVFVEYDWVPATNVQCEDRVHRIGQVNNVFCQYLAVPGTIDEVILNTVLKKMKQGEQLKGEENE